MNEVFFYIGRVRTNLMLEDYLSQYNEWAERRNILDKTAKNCLVVNTGSTAGYKAFDYSLWKDNGINLGFQPQPLYYDYEMLKKYSDHIAENASIFICIEHFKFYLDFYENEKDDYKYYFWLDSNQIRTYNQRTDWIIHHAPILLQPKDGVRAVKNTIKHLLNPDNNSYQQICSVETDIQHSYKWVDVWNKEFGWVRGQSVREEQFKTIAIVEKRLLDMIDYCIKHKWCPYIVILPLSPNLSGLLSDNVMNPGLWEPLERVRKLRDLRIIDYYNDKRFADWALFDNALVLNENGRKLFNTIIQNDMQR